jgi:DNA topoisomerase-1
MRIAQRLYEAGHITYMRTDHAVISEEAKKDAQAYVRTTYGEAYIGSEIQAQTATAQTAQTKSKKAKAKDEPKAQEAHEAIRPTHIELTDLPQSEDWNAVDRKIYTLIWNRTVQSVMAPCRGEERTVIFKATGDPNDLEWSAKWRRITFQGWRRVNQAIADLDESGPTTATAEESAWTLGQSLEAGQHITWATLEAAPKETKAAPRYTEATLVRELEKRGIGRPSTFASLVGTILDKTYVEKRDVPAKEVLIKSVHLDHVDQWPPTVKSTAKKVGGEKQKLAPTPLGTSALEFCLKEFPGLFAFTFTKEMEERLDKVAEGTEPWKTICRDTWGSYSTKYDELKKKTATQTQSAKQQMFGDIKAIQTKKGPLLLIEGPTKEETVFYGWPKGVSFAAITADLATKHVADAKKAKEGATIGEYEGQPMVRMKGPYGEYVTCGSSNVPWKEGDTPDTIRERLKSKGDAVLHTLGPFEFRRGPYGVFMFKKDVQQKKFVGLPQALDPKALTVEAAIKIYQTGLQEKAKKSTYASKRPPFKKKTDG